MRDLRRTYWLILSGGLMAAASVSNAQEPPQTPMQKADEAPSKKSGEVPLSKKLNENDGVLKPPSGIDPEIHQLPPAKTGDKMPVIIPPGEPGGDQSIQPK